MFWQRETLDAGDLRQLKMVYINPINIEYAVEASAGVACDDCADQQSTSDRLRISPDRDLLQVRFDHVFLLTVVPRIWDAFRAKQKVRGHFGFTNILYKHNLYIDIFRYLYIYII